MPKGRAAASALLLLVLVFFLALGGLGYSLLRQSRASTQSIQSMENTVRSLEFTIGAIAEPFLSGQSIDLDGIRTERFIGESFEEWAARDREARIGFAR